MSSFSLLPKAKKTADFHINSFSLYWAQRFNNCSEPWTI
ncbi:hypothetical protein P1059_01970 [Pasteurella multocida subsp. gallicida P1059]|nr:hypothetical protein PMCN03_1477 [Pasteurella multocida subsp. multocida str. HB03]EJZ77178.1 hypothetical protein X73_01876 [Pasteurella multocida subsp. gallicida X73]EJZ77460.1 hypothetical protein P1059_01970 [Pasteurella multocida subsp. gallicida P1059]